MAHYLVIDDGSDPVPITNFIGADGEDVDSWDEAVAFVAGPLPNGGWFSAPTADFEDLALN